MYSFKLLLICVLCHSCIAKVLEFGDDDFDSRMAQHDTALVMFYAPWCGDCKKLSLEFARAADVLSRHNPPVALVKVDCTKTGEETCINNGVRGYPTLKIFKSGKFSQDYNGPRDEKGIVEYMIRK